MNKHRDVADRGLAQIDELRHRTVTSRDGQQGSDTSNIEQGREKRGENEANERKGIHKGENGKEKLYAFYDDGFDGDAV